MATLIDKEIRCPFCRARVNICQRSCPGCSADLSLLSDLNLLPYALFNEGLALFASGEHSGALVKFAAAVEWAPEFREAHQMLARVAESLSTEDLAARHRSV